MKNFSLKQLFVAMVALLCSVAASAHDFEVGGIFYNFFGNDYLSVTYKGTSSDAVSNEYSGNVVIPESVTYNGKTYRVTSIGFYAFRDCSALTSVTIPGSVTEIATAAFENTGLLSVVIPGSVTSIGSWLFAGCENLKSVIIPSSVTSIGDNAFNGCSSLASITIPNSVTEIGGWAFESCTSLTSVEIPNGVTSIGAGAFQYCSGLKNVTIPNSITAIEGWAFQFCSALTSVTIPSSVTSIGECAFRECTNLENVYITDLSAWCNIEQNSWSNPLNYASNFYLNEELLTDIIIPEDITEIKDEAFAGYDNLKSVTIHDNLTSIGKHAFSNCDGLTNITIPSSVTSIGDGAFLSCSGLANVTSFATTAPSITESSFSDIPSTACLNYPAGSDYSAWKQYFATTSEFISGTCGDNLTWVLDNDNTLTISGSGAMYDYEENNKPWEEYENVISEVVIEEGVTSIGFYAFRDCSALKSVTIPTSVTEIATAAFENTGLLDVVIPGSVTSIASWLFAGCENLASVTIPNSVTSIGECAFKDCTSLANITIPNGVTRIEGWTFESCTSLTSVEIPNSVTSIGAGAFQYSSGLESVTIPSSVTSIEGWAFQYCSALTSVTIPSSVTSIGECAFRECTGLTDMVVPKSVTTIGHSAFNGAPWYDSQEGVIYIGSVLYYYHGEVPEKIVVKDGTKTIGCWAFEDCEDITSITIPASVTSIEFKAFENCSNLTSVTCESETPALLGDSVFLYVDLTEATLVVPNEAAVESYKAAGGWNEFGKIVYKKEALDPQMILSDQSASPGSSLVIPVMMNNEQEITAFQFDIYLPDGITVVTDDEDEFMVTLTDDRGTSSHTVTSSVLSNGGIRVAAYSSSNKPFKGTDGTIVNITTKVSDAMAMGDYTVTIKNIHMADADEFEYEIEEASATISVSFVRGDVNMDGKVSIGDIVAVVNHLLEKPTKVFNFAAADVNNDKAISVVDIVGIVNIILNPVATIDNGYNAKRGAVASNGDRMSISGVSSEGGNVTIPVSLENSTAYTAFQMDVELPEGATLASATLGSRAASSHSVTWSNIADNKVRVVAYSIKNATFANSTGELVTLNVQADGVNGTVAVDNVCMVTADGVENAIGGCGTTIDGNGTTMVDAIDSNLFKAYTADAALVVESGKDMQLPLYSINGRLLKVLDVVVGKNIFEALPTGVYVVNGKKIVIK